MFVVNEKMKTKRDIEIDILVVNEKNSSQSNIEKKIKSKLFTETKIKIGYKKDEFPRKKRKTIYKFLEALESIGQF